MTKAPIQISLAIDTDFKALASIVLEAQKQDPSHTLLFDRSQLSSVQDEVDHTELLVWSSIKSDNCRVSKAVSEEKRILHKRQTIVGLSIINFIDRTPAPPTFGEEAQVYRHQPQSLNSRLLESTHAELELLQNKLR